MSNTLLTPSMITKRALLILHQKCNFIGNVNRGYDKSFAKDGAKIGDTLKIRLPNQYTVRTNATLATQDTQEQYVSLPVTNQYGVDLNFTTAELSLSMDNFAERVLDPAMSVLAAKLESVAMTAFAKDIYNVVNNVGSAITLRQTLLAGKALTDNLAPSSPRVAILNTTDKVDLIDALKALFQDSEAIKKQYREGQMGRTGGFDFYENTLVPTITSGTALSGTGYLVNAAGQSGAAIAISGAATTFKIGDVVTFAGCNRCHPETKDDTGVLQQFVVTSDYSGGSGNLAISPAIKNDGAYQNVTSTPTNGGAVTKVGGGASFVHKPSLFFHRDAFTFATADLIMPKGVHFSAREVMDDISMRIVQAYDINNDKLPCRVDVLFGYKTIRPQLGCRLESN